ncbi:hypothetical protein EVA_19759 [gut metagenome]|uniref:Uncharacterized protein n=1 Tax=gut metagenome TaxID=749906 RepID=J9FXR5_9ZZZZ
MKLIFSIRFNDNCGHLSTSGAMHTWLNSYNSTTYAGMYRCTDKAYCLTNLLTYLHMISNLYDWICRCTKML